MQKGCSGACDQGRKECITPFACELEVLTEHKGYEKAVTHLISTVLVFLIACCLYFIWSVFNAME